MTQPDLSAVLDHYEVRHDPTKTGNQAIKCPVHEDSHASASCNLDKQLWNCHACEAGGTAIDLIMAKEGIDYKAAVAIGEGFAPGSGGEVRDKRVAGGRVPDGSGYRPRYFRGIPARRRSRPDYGA